MITEIAQIDVTPGREDDFLAGVTQAGALFARAKGYLGHEIQRSIEKPSRFRLMIRWETLDHHIVDFRGSDDFQTWRGLVGATFAAPPDVEHTETVIGPLPGRP